MGTFGAPYDNTSKMIYEYYMNFELREEFDILVNHVESILKKLIIKYQNKYDNLNKTLNDSKKADIQQKKADMLMAYLHKYSFNLNC